MWEDKQMMDFFIRGSVIMDFDLRSIHNFFNLFKINTILDELINY